MTSKIKTTLKIKTTWKIKTMLRMKTTAKMRTTTKWRQQQKWRWPQEWRKAEKCRQHENEDLTYDMTYMIWYMKQNMIWFYQTCKKFICFCDPNFELSIISARIPPKK